MSTHLKRFTVKLIAFLCLLLFIFPKPASAAISKFYPVPALGQIEGTLGCYLPVQSGVPRSPIIYVDAYPESELAPFQVKSLYGQLFIDDAPSPKSGSFVLQRVKGNPDTSTTGRQWRSLREVLSRDIFVVGSNAIPTNFSDYADMGSGEVNLAGLQAVITTVDNVRLRLIDVELKGYVETSTKIGGRGVFYIPRTVVTCTVVSDSSQNRIQQTINDLTQGMALIAELMFRNGVPIPQRGLKPSLPPVRFR